MSKRTIEIVLSPLLLDAHDPQGKVCVVIDILRASTTMITAMANGATAIYPIASLKEAEKAAEQGYLVGAERNVKRCPFAHFGNDPREYSPEAVAGKEIYFTTTNGTRTIEACMEWAAEVMIGGFSNLTAVAAVCRDKDILAVCAGWQGQVSLEDSLYAAALVEALGATHTPISDATRMLSHLWQQAKVSSVAETIQREADHYQRLKQHGLEHTLSLCLEIDTHNIVPIAVRDDNGQTKLILH